MWGNRQMSVFFNREQAESRAMEEYHVDANWGFPFSEERPKLDQELAVYFEQEISKCAQKNQSYNWSQ